MIKRDTASHNRPVAIRMGAGSAGTASGRSGVRRVPLPGSTPVEAPETKAKKTSGKKPAKTPATTKAVRTSAKAAAKTKPAKTTAKAATKKEAAKAPAKTKAADTKREKLKALSKPEFPIIPSDRQVLAPSSFSFFGDRNLVGLSFNAGSIPLLFERAQNIYLKNSINEDDRGFDSVDGDNLTALLNAAKKISLNEAINSDLLSTGKSSDQFDIPVDSPKKNLDFIHETIAIAFLETVHESGVFLEDLVVKDDLLSLMSQTLDNIDKSISEAIKSNPLKLSVKDDLRDNARKLSALAFTLTSALYYNEHFDTEESSRRAYLTLGRSLAKLSLLADINSSFSEPFKDRRVTGVRKRDSLSFLERKPLNIFDLSAFERLELGFIDYVSEQKHFLSKGKSNELSSDERALASQAKKNLGLLGNPSDDFQFSDITKGRYETLRSLRTLLRTFDLAKENLSNELIEQYFDEVDIEIQNWISKIYANNSTLAELTAADKALELLSLSRSNEKGLDLDSLEQYLAEMITAPNDRGSLELLSEHLTPKFKKISKKIIADLKKA